MAYERRPPQLGDPWEPPVCCWADCTEPRTAGGPLVCEACAPLWQASIDAGLDRLAALIVRDQLRAPGPDAPVPRVRQRAS